MARVDTLGHFLTDVADAIRTKTGSSESITASDFDTEIENIPSGESTPTNVEEAQEQIIDVMKALDQYWVDMPNSYSAYTQNAATLYTPNANNMFYVIRYRSEGWQIMWVPQKVVRCTSVSSFGFWGMYGQLRYDDIPNTHFVILPRPDLTMTSDSVTFYTSPYYQTEQEAIAAIQSSTTTYSSSSSSSFGYSKVSDNVYIPYTNLPMEVVVGGIHREFVVKKISANETISVIQ